MGDYIKKIATIDEPKTISLSDIPNYIQFTNNSSTEGRLIEVAITVNNNTISPPTNSNEEETEKFVAQHSTIAFVEYTTNNEHIIKGTKNRNNVNSSTYFINDHDANLTASNIKDCLMQNTFVASNFKVDIAFNKNEQGEVLLNNVIHLTSMGKGEKYIITFKTKESDDNKIVTISPYNPSSSNSDSIDNGSGKVAIELEVYTNTDSLLGENKFPDTSMGTYMTTLRKSYHGMPLWFNLNALMANKSTFKNDFLTATGWCDAGTATDYRFVARRFDGANREPIYLSDVLYNITGYNRNLETVSLDKYVYDAQKRNRITPLSNQPTLHHVKGQSQYFNFILADQNRNPNHQTGITYRLYSQSKAFIAEQKTTHNGTKLAVVNTIKLNIDQYIDQYQNVGYVEVYLNVAGETQSQPHTFRILPQHLYAVNDFAFLNALGGWSSFNFGGNKKTDFKASTTSIFKTQTPQHTISSQIEGVYSKEVKEQFSAKTMPINATTVEWLKEMSASMAVYELSTNRYIVVDELDIKPNSKDELFEVEMKYRYSDSYNGKQG